MDEAASSQSLGKYQLFEQIGEGGMGRVFRARHSMLGSDAAIKVLRTRHSRDKDTVNRFFNEARATSTIRHPGIVSIFDFGFADDGRAFIVMELLDGQSLGDLLKRHKKFPEEAIFRYIRQAAGVLASAHAVGIIHRDLKPDNLFVIPDPEVVGGERVKVLDFGIAKLSGAIAQNVSKTATGAILGSPLYMSPEQCEGAGATGFESDIYSLGCVMYEMAVGRPPFGGSGIGALLAKHIYEKPTPPIELNPSVTKGLSDLILATLEKNPKNRPESMEDVALAIDRLSGGITSEFGKPPKYAHTPVRSGGHSANMMPTLGALQQTTHGSSSGQISASPHRRPRGGRLFVALGVLVILGGAATTLVLVNRGDDSPSDPTAAHATSFDAAPTASTLPAREDAAVDEVEVIETVSFEITSVPAGALVRDASRKLLGETPLTLTVDKGGIAQEFIITRVGYDDSRLSLMPDEDREKRVTLAKSDDASKKTASKKRTKSRTRPDTKNKNKNKKKKKSGFGETIDPLDD